MGRDRRLIEKGEDAPLQGLLDQGRYHVELSRKYAVQLAEDNWTEAQTSALAADLETLGSAQARALDERWGARQTTREEGAAVSNAKALVNKVRNVAPQVVRRAMDAGVTLADFNAGQQLARVAPRISQYLGKIRGPAAKLDRAFAPFFKNQSLVGLIDAAKKRIDDASTTQAVDWASLPDDTAGVLELKGKILEAIEDMNAIGRNAFDGEAETRAMFNKDILNKARRSRPKKDEPTPTPS